MRSGHEKKQAKRLLCLLFSAVLLCASLTGCSGEGRSGASEKNADTLPAVHACDIADGNLDLPDVIAVRNELLPASGREENIPCDLNDYSWMDRIDASEGAVFFAAGVFYYFKTEDVKKLFAAMTEHFPSAVLAFDSCNRRGAKMMRKTWLKEAGITDVNAYFSLDDPNELKDWDADFASVSSKSYMRGYRDIYGDVGLFHRLMIRFCDGLVNMRIVKIGFGRRSS